MQVGLLASAVLSGYLVLVILMSLTAIRGYRMFRPLVRSENGEGHRVSIVVAAKQEADTLRESLASLAELAHPEREVIVVCGPSSDGTDEVAREFAGRMTILQEPPRPPDWIGKSWACHHGYLRSKGDVLLFADGDVVHSRDSLDVALANLDSQNADLLSLWPEIVTRARSERVIFPASLFFLCAGISFTSSRQTPEGRVVDGANGQYIMVRRDAYERIGGHEAIRNEVMEDGAMGRRTRANGLKVVNRDGDGYVKVMPYSGFREAWQAHERFGAGLVPSWGALAGASALTLVYFVVPFALLGVGVGSSAWGASLAAALACAAVYATDAVFTLKSSRPWYLLLAPISGLIVTAAFATGFVRFRRGGITWKGVKYGRDRFKPL